MHEPLQNKFVVIADGSRRPGAATVKRLGRKGAHLALTYHTSPDRARQVAQRAGCVTGASLTINGGFNA